jgi:hypothetical protein
MLASVFLKGCFAEMESTMKGILLHFCTNLLYEKSVREFRDLKGLSQEIDLAFDDMYSEFLAEIGDGGPMFKFLSCSNDL